MSCIVGCNAIQVEQTEDEQQVDVTIQSIPDCLVIFGRITDCAKHNKPVTGALVKVFKCVDNKLIGICHTFSGCNGYYMLHVTNCCPQDKLMVMATCGCVPHNFCASGEASCNCHEHSPHIQAGCWG